MIYGHIISQTVDGHGSAATWRQMCSVYTHPFLVADIRTLCVCMQCWMSCIFLEVLDSVEISTVSSFIFWLLKIFVDAVNDLWQFNIATGQWSFISGDTSVIAPSKFGAMGIPSLSNAPAARQYHGMISSPIMNSIFLFGGRGYTRRLTCLFHVLYFSSSRLRWYAFWSVDVPTAKFVILSQSNPLP
jgi:hypothetical protein